jgi:hypothetical protein
LERYPCGKRFEDNGITEIRFHDLRHSCATLFRHEEMPMEDIPKWLGHFEITTTEGLHAHFDDSQNVKMLAKISGAGGQEVAASFLTLPIPRPNYCGSLQFLLDPPFRFHTRHLRHITGVSGSVSISRI